MQPGMKIAHVIVDGSNIATEGRDAPSLAQLDEAVSAFIDEYQPDHVTVVVDATFPNRIDRKERQTYEDAVNANELITPPAGAIGRGDAFVLQIARRAGASILSNDSFQEFHGEYPWLFERGRLIGGKPVPHVGWVFMERAPVRGPTSRRSVSEARKVAKTADKVAKIATEVADAAEAADAAGAAAGNGSGEAEAKPTRRRRSSKPAKAAAAAVVEAAPEPSTDGLDDPLAKGGPGRGVEPYNEAMPFIEFVGEYPVGSEVEATIERFSSHGAYVLVGDARAYVPLRNLADPAPRSAKEMLRVGETRRFVVVTIDPPRRGIDLALPGIVDVPAATLPESPEPDGAVDTTVAATPDAPAPAKSTRKRAAKATVSAPDPDGAAPTRKRGAKKAAAAADEPAAAAPARKRGTTKAAEAEQEAPARKRGGRKAAEAPPEPAPAAPARKRGARMAAATPEGPPPASDAAPARKRGARKAAEPAPADAAPARKRGARKAAAATDAPAAAASARKRGAKAAAPVEEASPAPVRKRGARKAVAAAESPAGDAGDPSPDGDRAAAVD